MGFRYAETTRLIGSLVGARVAQWGQRSVIKSIQRGTIVITGATSNTATITAVDVGNSLLRFLGSWTSDAADTDAQSLVQIVLTNATTITATVATSPAGNNTTCGYEIVEYYPGVLKSVQRGQTTAAATTQALTAIDTTKTLVYFLGNTDTAGVIDRRHNAIIALNSSTQLGISYGGANAQTVSWQVAEFY